MRMSSAGFSVPIFALALASFLPAQVQADCSNLTSDNANNYADGVNNDVISVCDPNVADPNNNDATPEDAADIILDNGNDKLTVGTGVGVFTVLNGIDAGAGDDTLLITAGSILANNVNVNMGDDDDTVTLEIGAQADFTQVDFKGGNGGTNDDTFQVSNVYTGQVGTVLEFEHLDLSDIGTTLTLTENVEFTLDTKIAVGTVLDFGANLTLKSATVINDSLISLLGGGVGNFVIDGNVNNNAVITLLDGLEGDKLTIQGTGNFTGANQSTIFLDVFIGGSGSPADNVVITGAVDGTTGLLINPTGFDPQFTGTGPGNGIQLVDVSAGTTNGDDFFLTNGPIVTGPFVYDLVLEVDNIWYLQSRLDDIFQAFPGMVTAAQQQGDMVQGTLHQRMGDLRHEEEKHANKNAFQLWMRGFGGGNSVDNDTGRFDDRTSGLGADFDGGFDTVTYGGQGGADYGFASLFTDSDRFHLGVMGFYGHTDVDFGVLPVRGDINGYGGGVYATYIHPNFYVDTSVLAGKLDFKTRDNARGQTDKYDGSSIGASIETGVPITMGQFVIEPQLQLTYRDVRFDSFDSAGVDVSSDDGESLKGRAGARFAVNLNPSEGVIISPYLTASVVQEFMGDNTIDADNVSVHSDVEGTSFDGGLGVTASFGNAVSLFAESGGTFGDDVDSFRGNLGIRVSW